MSTQPGPTPPIVLPPDVYLPTAQLCATLTNSAYDQFDQWAKQGYPAPSSFKWVSNGPSQLTYSPALWGNAVVLDTWNPEPFGFVASDGKGNVYVAFRGSMTTADDWNDADFAQVAYALVNNPSFGCVASGFRSVYTTRVSSQIRSLRDITNTVIAGFRPCNLYITGHSLGAALCTLTVPDVVYNLSNLQLQALALYNFASPRVGELVFANAMNNEVTKKLTALLFRIVNTEDVVPTLPPAVSTNVYEHVGTPVSFSAQYSTVDGNHSMENCYTYAINHPQAPQGPQSAFVNVVTGFARGRKYVPETLIVPGSPAD